MTDLPGFTPLLRKEVFEETKSAGAELIKLKGGSGFAVGLSIREVVHALALDRRQILPVSTMQMGAYGLRDVCLSVPTQVGCGGALKHVEIPLDQKERLGLEQSARVLRATIDRVEERIGKAGKEQPAGTPRSPVPSPRPDARAIPRRAWAH